MGAKSSPACLIVEDQVLFADLLRSALLSFGSFRFLQTASCGKEALHRLSEAHFDLVVVDYWLPDDPAHKLIETIHRLYPDLPAVILTASSDCEVLRREFSGKVRYVLDKMMPLDDLIGLLTGCVDFAGETVVNEPDKLAVLTSREKELLRSLALGMSNKEISATLGISINTVETHRKSISKKLDIHGAALIRYAVICHLQGMVK